jgi:prepilin peptidase CpaA
MLRILLLVLFAALAAYFDFRYRLVPNWLILACLACGALLALIGGFDACSRYGLGLFFGSLILLPAFIFNMVGGGDVKSLAVIGLLTGPHLLWISFMRGSILGGILAVSMIAARFVRKKRHASPPLSESRGSRAASMPYAGILALTAAVSAFI